MFRRFPLKSSLAFALIALASPAAALRPIDDFEVGPFFFQSTGAYQEHEVHVDQHQGHLYTSPRGVVLEPFTGSSSISTQLAPAGGDDAAELIIESGGRVRFACHWSVPFGVTENGTYNRIEVSYDFVTPDAYFTFGIGDQSSSCGVGRFPGIGPGVVVVDIERQFMDSMVPPIPSPPLTWISEVSRQPLFDLAWLADWEGDHLSGVEPPPASGHAARTLIATPNPFNPRTTFSLAVPPGQPVTVEIFDARGRRVRELEGAALRRVALVR